MQDVNKKCAYCSNFQYYYTEGTKNFNKTKFGRCCSKNETVDACSTCESWRLKCIIRKSTRAAERTLNDILHNISALRQIIEERQEEYEDLRQL